MKARGAILVAIVAAAGLLAACGGGDEGEEGPARPEQPAGEETVSVTLDDFSIRPMDVVVERGATIDAENVGAVAHNFTVEEGADASRDTRDLAATSTFGPGESDELEIDLSAGRYATVCTVANHRELGMVGTLTVR